MQRSSLRKRVPASRRFGSESPLAHSPPLLQARFLLGQAGRPCLPPGLARQLAALPSLNESSRSALILQTAATDYKRLRELIDRGVPESKRGKIPILSGEWGYASNTKGISLETQAAFAVRQQLCNLLNSVPLSIWYDWKNDGQGRGCGAVQIGLSDWALSWSKIVG